MQISGQDPIRFLEKYLLDVKEVSDSTPASGGSEKGSVQQDQVEISARGRESQSLLQQVNSLPDVRTNRVNEVRQKIASGQYVVEDRKVAAGLVRSALLDNIL
jgi:negative regulator of flagellin synthesis FlgM